MTVMSHLLLKDFKTQQAWSWSKQVAHQLKFKQHKSGKNLEKKNGGC